MRWPIVPIAFFLVFSSIASRAGGPAFVAGSGYDPGVEGAALVWANGSLEYFTDQGDLSPILTGAQADALVAAAFSTWTGIPGVALIASQGGHLAEDVNGGNIAVDANGVISAPGDITSPAISTPIGIVYDNDGTVTDVLLGAGAGSVSDCFSNAVFGGPDNFSTGGNITHALVVMNGVCASTSAQLPDVQYGLTRVLGRTIGLGWSQANVNVLTRNPPPGPGDFAGFPLMHFADPISCVPISGCYNDATVPKLDDIDVLARLYPAAANPQAAGRIYGSVYFTDASGNALQPMQGVNVVARLMISGQPLPQYVVSSVSGFAFSGNAGNMIDGYVDVNGLRYDRWGSKGPSREGFFDLGQLPIPAGQTIAQYQLSVEALDPDWSLGVAPYAYTPVIPSGSFAPVVVTVSNGSNTERDILMLGDAIAQAHPGIGSTYANPAALPQGGAWGSWISGYGSADFFEFKAQANRTASISVTALDETGHPTETKLMPVIGIWQLSDQTGNPAPAFTPSAFNSTTFAMTRLDAQFGVTDTFRVGVADFRGDGRPDFFYQASLLYSDTVTPARLSLAGGVTALNGTGFKPGLQVSVAGNDAIALSVLAGRIQAALPPGLQDGTASIQVTDPVSGASSQMIGALSYGAQATDRLLLLQGAEPATTVGAQSPSPIRVRAVAADGVTPVSGATIAWRATNGLLFSACSGLSFCSVLSDEAGESSSWVTPVATGAATVTAELAPASYSPPQAQQATILATSTALDLVALTPTRWIGQGAAIAVPLNVVALDLGLPKANVPVNFTITRGVASISAGSATTNGSGNASIVAQLTNQQADVQVSACVAPDGAPCQIFTLFSTPSTLWQFETVSGSRQVVPTGNSFQPLAMRVTDGSMAANPVMGVTVTFETTLARSSSSGANSNTEAQTSDSTARGDGLPILLGTSQSQVMSNQDGLASITPSVGSVGPCDMFVTVSAGGLTVPFQMEGVAPLVAPIVPVEPPNGSVDFKARSAQRGAYFVPAAVSPTSVPSGVPLLFAIAESIPSHEPPPDLPASEDSEASVIGGNCDEAGPLSSNLVATRNAASPRCSGSEPVAARADEHKKAVRAESHVASKGNPTSLRTAVSGSGLAEDKRSCRMLAADGPTF